MEYEYEMDVYSHNMSMHPSETKKGVVTLKNRPMVGEEIQIDGKWHRIATIRHTDKSMVLKMADSRPNS
jgi:hypothetical protein